MANGFKHAPDFTISAFRNGDPVPAIGSFTATVFDRAELRNAVIEFHAIQQILFFFAAQTAKHAHSVLSLKTKSGVHQIVRQFARTGEQQQPFGIQIKTSNRLPFALVQLGQPTEHSWAILRIVMSHHFTHRFVIGDDTGRRRVNAKSNGFAIDFDMVAKLNALTDVGRFVVDGNSPLHDQLLHFQPRSHASLSQYFVQLGGFDLGCQHPLRQGHLRNFFVRVELSRNHIVKTIRGGIR